MGAGHGNGQPHECTIDDIKDDHRFSGSILLDIMELQLEETDNMDLAVYFDYKPTEDEVHQIETKGIEINTHSWIPTGVESPAGSLSARAKVKDICKLTELDFIISVESGMRQPFPWQD